MSSGMPFCAVSQEFLEQADANRDYQVIHHDNVFRYGLSHQPVMESVYYDLGVLLASLLDQYKDCSIPDVLTGTTISTECGSCYLIEHTQPLTIPCYAKEDIQKILFRDLTLIRGIGKKRAAFLRQRGCQDVRDLVWSRHYAHRAHDSIDIIESGGKRLYQEVARWHGHSHPLTLLTSGLYPPESFMFLDIETLGMFCRPLFLIGTGIIRGNSIHISQFLAQDIWQEAAVLEAFQKTMQDTTVFVSFNGKSFDIPYIKSRLAYYDKEQELPNLHYDLLHCARHYMKKNLCDCRLNTLEEHILGIRREMDVPGAMVPEWYETYRIHKNPGPLIPIIHHNRQDIISLAELFVYFQKLAYGDHSVS